MATRAPYPFVKRGERIRTEMRQRKLRLVDIAIATASAVPTVSHWLTGRTAVPPPKARKLFERFGIPLNTLRPDVWP